MAGYLGATPVPQATQHRESFTATAGQTTFATAGYTVGFVDVYLNGVHLTPADVTATNGSDVVLGACLVNDIVDVISHSAFELNAQTFTGVTSFADGSAGAPSITNTGDVNTGIFFPAADTIAFAEGGAEVMRIDSSSRLLIGSTASQENNHRLQITGGDQATSSISVSRLSADQYGAHVEYLGTRSTSVGSNTIVQANDTLGLLIFRGDDGTNFATEAASIRGAVDGTPGENDMPGRLTFFTTADGAATGTERMRIDSSGNLLVATTATTNVSDGVVISAGGGVLACNTDNISGQFRRNGSNGTVIEILNDASAVGTIAVNGSATAYNTSSDYRLKKDARPMANASARVLALKPVNFEWIADGSRVDGFLAHEAQAVVPECVTGTKDAMRDEEYEVTPAVLDDDGNETKSAVMGTRSVPDMQGIDQSKIVPLLVAALQEALARITVLEG